MNKKKKTLVVTLSIVLMLLAIIATTYAYFTASLTGNSDARSIIVSTNYNSVAVLTSNNSIYTWGNNSNNQLGNGIYNFEKNPTRIMGDIKKISMSGNSLIAQTKTNDLYTWGENQYGQLGTGNTQVQNIPKLISSVGKVNDIATGTHLSIVINSNNDVYTTGYYVGTNASEQVTSTTFVKNNSSFKGKSIYSSGQVGFIIDNDDYLCTWGANQTGTASYNHYIPTKISTLPKISQISSSHYTGLALDFGGNIYTWGNLNSNRYGEYGNGTWSDSVNQPVPAQLIMPITFKYISGYSYTMLGISTTGELYIWGSYSNGTQSCYLGSKCNTLPTKIEGLPKVKYAYSNDSQTLAIDEDNNLWMWGIGYFGDGEGIKTISTPTKINAVGTVTSGYTNGSTVILLKENGDVWGFGHNGYGQLGNSFTTYSTTPVKIVGI